MKKLLLLLLLLLPILSFGQNCAPTLIVKDTCSYGYAKTFVEWESLDSGCVIDVYHQGTPYNTYSYGWNDQLDTNNVVITIIVQEIHLLVQMVFSFS